MTDINKQAARFFKLHEAAKRSTARMHHHLQAGKAVGFITADQHPDGVGDAAANNRAKKELHSQLKSKGYSPVPVKGFYTYEKTGKRVRENTFMVHHDDHAKLKSDLISLGGHHNQESVLVAHRDHGAKLHYPATGETLNISNHPDIKVSPRHNYNHDFGTSIGGKTFRFGESQHDADMPTWHIRQGKLHIGNYKPQASYGEPGKGDSVVGIHYSHMPRESLSGSKYGKGMKGAEARRLSNSSDDHIKHRVHFYVDEGKGITPESGVGHHEHGVHLHNMYNAQTNVHGFDKSDPNTFESSVVKKGYSGVYYPAAQGDQGAAVLLGKHHDSVPTHQFQKNFA